MSTAPAGSRHGPLRELLRQAYGRAPATVELDWWLDGNPVEPHLLALEPSTGAAGMSLFRVGIEGEELLAGFIVHAVTAPHARGRGVFKRLQEANEQAAAEAGAVFAFGFTTAMATRALVGRRGWQLLGRPRIWARPRLRRAGSLAGDSIDPFEQRHEQLDPAGPLHFLKDARWLDWRYCDSPRPYRRVDIADGYAVVGIGWHRGLVAGAICELVGGGRALRHGVRAVRAPVVFGLPARGQRLLYLAAGFVPTPWRLNLVGRALDPTIQLPKEWRLGLGDTDFF